MKLLALAPLLDRNDVGEAWSTYQWVRGLAEHCDVTVLTYRKSGHERPTDQLRDLRVIEWNDLPLVGRFERFNSMLKPGYTAFYARARRWLRRALASGESFDLAHQLAPLAPRYPCPAAGLGIPWIVGPLGGSIPEPRSFGDELGGAAWYVRARRFDEWRFAHDPLLRRSLEGAACVIGVAPYMRTVLDGLALQRFEVESETGILDLPDATPARAREPGELSLLFVGRLVPTKGAIYAIRALGRRPDLVGVRLDVIGDGDDRERCAAEVRRSGLEDRVRLHGRLQRAQVETFYAGSDAFVFPSLKEPSGNVVFEAMRHGLPVIACAAGGPGYVVDDTCGLLVLPTDPDALVAGVADAVAALATDRALLETLRAGARARVAELALWDVKVERMRNLYDEIVGRAAQRPSAVS